MANIVLGAVPENLEVVLVRNADFFTTLITEDSTPWPVGVEIKLILDDNTFTATIVGAEASFGIDSVQVNTLIDARTRFAKLMYIDGPAEICWAIGEVISSG